MKGKLLRNVLASGALLVIGIWIGRESVDRAERSPNKGEANQKQVSGTFRQGRQLAGKTSEPSTLQAWMDELKNFTGSNNQMVRLSVLSATLPLADIAPAFEAADLVHFPGYRHAVRLLLFRRWAVLAPRAAAVLASATADASERREALWAVTEGWGEHDPHGAVAWVKTMPPGSLREECMINAIKALASVAPEQALSEIEGMHHASKRNALFPEVFHIWAAKDPASAGGRALSFPPGFLRNEALTQLAAAWSERDPSSALDWFNRLPDARERNKFLYTVLHGLLQVDAPAAAKALASLTQRDVPQSIFFEVAGAWAKVDPQAAIAWARQLPSQLQEGAITTALADWARQDPEAAWIGVQQLPESAARRMGIGAVMERMSEVDPRTAAKLALSLPPGEVRDWVSGIVGKALAEGSTQEAKDWLATLEPELKAKVTYDIAYKLAEHDPAAALELSSSLPAEQKEQVVSTSLGVWVGEDADGAIAWAGKLTDPGLRRLAFDRLCENWARLDPNAAAAYASQFPEGTVRTDALTRLAGNWAEFDGPGALAWAGTLSEGEARTKAVSTAASEWAARAPADAANYVSSLPPGEAQDKAALHVLSRWTTASPREAAAWVTQFPESSLRERACRELIDVWAMSDVSAAEQWVTALPRDVARENAIDALAKRMASGGHYHKAGHWAEQLTDETSRINRMREIARRWKALDPSGANSWIESLRLSEAQKFSLMKN